MLSFHNDPAVKEKYVARILHHQKMDNIIQARYPIELGLPEWLAQLQDIIFENLPNPEAKLWPHKSLCAIPVGVDIEPIKHKLAILRLNRLIDIQENLLEKNHNSKEVFLQVINAIKLVKQCHEAALSKNSCDWEAAMVVACAAARAIWTAPWSAASTSSMILPVAVGWSAESAACAAESAAESAAEESAACSAACLAAKAAAGSAAWSAAWLAPESAAGMQEWTVAWTAAKIISWQQEAADLINLLEEAKSGEITC